MNNSGHHVKSRLDPLEEAKQSQVPVEPPAYDASMGDAGHSRHSNLLMGLAPKIIAALPASVAWRMGAVMERGLRGLMYYSGYRLRTLERQHRHISISRETSEFLNDPESVLLLTMPKAGTHWMCYLIGNYIAKATDNQTLLGMTNEEVKAALFANPRNGLVWKGASINRTPPEYIDTPFNYIFFQHTIPGKNNAIFFTGKRILLYRNPRDWIISVHHYFSDRKDLVYSPRNYRDAINYMMPIFCESMKCIRSLHQCDKDLLLSYEDLVANTSEALRQAVTFLELPVDDEAVAFSVEKSSASSTRNQGSLIARVNAQTFVRDARVGQWKERLSAKDVRLIDAYLQKNDIDAGNFRYIV